MYLCKDNKIITPGKMHPFYSVYFVQWPGLAGAIGRDIPGRGRGDPGRCGSFTGAWCLPRPRRSRYGHNKQISLEGKQKCLAAAWLLPGRDATGKILAAAWLQVSAIIPATVPNPGRWPGSSSAAASRAGARVLWVCDLCNKPPRPQ